MREEHPLAALLQTRRARQDLPAPETWVAVVAALYGVPALIMAGAGLDNVRWFLATAGAFLLVALPWYHFRADVSLLTSLRRGRCLEEVLTTGLDAAGMVDALARHSVGSILRPGLPVWAVLVLGSLGQGFVAQAVAVLWLPMTVLAFFVGSYVVQMLSVWSRHGEGASVPQAVLGLGALGLVGLTVTVASGFAEPSGSVATLAAGALLLAWGCRFLAIWGLENLQTVDRWNDRGAATARRNRWVRPWSENPIVVRETARQAAAVPGGFVGLVALRSLGALLPLGWALLVLEAPAAYWVGLAGLAGLSFLRAAGRTLPAVVGEREQRTLDSVLQVPLGEFLSGWMQVGARPLVLEMVPAALVALAFPGVEMGLLAAALLLLAPVSGAAAGLAVSAVSPTRREASSHLLAWLLWALVAGLALSSAVSAGALLLAGSGWLDAGGPGWVVGMRILVPLGSALAVLGLATAVALRTARAALAPGWVRAEAGRPGRVDGAFGRRLLMVPGALAGAAMALGSEALGRTGLEAGAEAALAGGSGAALGTVVGGLLWALGSRLVELLADRFGGRLGKAALLGAALGGLAGAAVALAPMMFDHALAWFGLQPSRDSLTTVLRVISGGSASAAAGAGLFTGLVLGCAGSFSARPGAAPAGALRAEIGRLARRLAWGMAALLLALGAAFAALYVPPPDGERLARLEEAVRSAPARDSWTELQRELKAVQGWPTHALREALRGPSPDLEVRLLALRFGHFDACADVEAVILHAEATSSLARYLQEGAASPLERRRVLEALERGALGREDLVLALDQQFSEALHSFYWWSSREPESVRPWLGERRRRLFAHDWMRWREIYSRLEPLPPEALRQLAASPNARLVARTHDAWQEAFVLQEQALRLARGNNASTLR